MEIVDEIRIPHDRIAILIGRNGYVKKKIEKSTGVNIQLRKDIVLIIADNGLKVMNAKNIVKAIGRGFNPKYAMLLLDENFTINYISLNNMSEKRRKVIMGRVIGRNGSVRKRIERETNTKICIYGKTISIIGEHANVNVATSAIENIVKGKKIETVLKNIRRDMEYVHWKST